MTYGIHTDRAPRSNGPFSQGAAAARYIFDSGQVGDDPETGELVSDDVALQVERAIRNMQAVLNEAKLDLEDVVKVTAYVRDLDQIPTIDLVYRELFLPPRPARTCVQVEAVRKGAAIELECVACR